MITPAFTRTIDAMTAEQLHRTYRRIMEYVNRGGSGGWDAPTLRAVHPHAYAALVAIARKHREVAPYLY